MRALRAVARIGLPVLVAAIAVAGCAAHAPLSEGPGVTAAARVPIAMLPLENLSGRTEYGDRFSRLVWSTLGRGPRFQVVDPGEVDATLLEMRIRSAGSLTREQILKMAGRLRVRWVLAGTLLECGTAHTPDGDVPSFSLALRLLDGQTGKVVWTDVRARSGEDRETIFGLGREESLERLAASTATDLVSSMRFPRVPDSLQTMEGRP